MASRLIAHELVKALKSAITVDRTYRDSARAPIRAIVRHLLQKHGYPPDLQAATVDNVVQQAEALSVVCAV